VSITDNLRDLLVSLGACSEAVNWVGDRDLVAAYRECSRADWLLWLASRMAGRPGWPTEHQVRRATAACAEKDIAWAARAEALAAARAARAAREADGAARAADWAARAADWADWAARAATLAEAGAAARAAREEALAAHQETCAMVREILPCPAIGGAINNGQKAESSG
jgi:hypothetical protein